MPFHIDPLLAFVRAVGAAKSWWFTTLEFFVTVQIEIVLVGFSTFVAHEIIIIFYTAT